MVKRDLQLFPRLRLEIGFRLKHPNVVSCGIHRHDLRKLFSPEFMPTGALHAHLQLVERHELSTTTALGSQHHLHRAKHGIQSFKPQRQQHSVRQQSRCFALRKDRLLFRGVFHRDIMIVIVGVVVCGSPHHLSQRCEIIDWRFFCHFRCRNNVFFVTGRPCSLPLFRFLFLTFNPSVRLFLGFPPRRGSFFHWASLRDRFWGRRRKVWTL